MKILIVACLFFGYCALLRSAEELSVDGFLDKAAVRETSEQQNVNRYFGVYSLLDRTDYTPEFARWYKERTGYYILDASHIVLKIDVPFIAGSPRYVVLEPMIALGGADKRLQFPSRGVRRYFLDFSLQEDYLANPLRKWDSIIGIVDTAQNELNGIHLKYVIDESNLERYFSPLRMLMSKTSK